MAVESAADRLALLDSDEYGVAATYSGSTVYGIFDNDYFDGIADAGVPVESAQPRFLCRTADVSSVAHDETILISGVTYTIVGIEPDGTGMTNLILEAP